jgi:hypothetical protein
MSNCKKVSRSPGLWRPNFSLASLTLRTVYLVIFPLLLLAFLPGLSHAQEPTNDILVDWEELKTENFVIVYADSILGVAPGDCECGVEQAEFYAAFADQVYEELVAVFGVELETPINLRLFPTEESYYEVNPIARQITGVIAHALNNREEIAIALPRTRSLTEEEIINNVRHELTHFFASLLSDGKLTTGFQEGIAQYLEKPTERTSYDPAVLKLAFEQGRLLSWAELDKSEQVFRDPQVAYPQTLAIASFLIDRYGFETFVEFIKANTTEPGYRSALETTYQKSADELESEWLEYLPDYFEGRWQINAIYAFDLSRIRSLVEKGAYTDAEVELVDIIKLLETTNQPNTLAEAETLLAHIHQGQAAGKLVGEARQALLADDYALAITKSNEAIGIYEALNYRERIPEIQLYIQRAEIGQQALAQLEQGEQLLDSLRLFEAEEQINKATVLLQSLGNEAGQERGLALLSESTQRKSLFGYGMLGVGVMLLLGNGLRRIVHHLSAHPLEVEFT